MAELVDAADSKSAVRKNVLVRFQSRALDEFFMSLVIIVEQGLIFWVCLKIPLFPALRLFVDTNLTHRMTHTFLKQIFIASTTINKSRRASIYRFIQASNSPPHTKFEPYRNSEFLQIFFYVFDRLWPTCILQLQTQIRGNIGSYQLNHIAPIMK